jgi:hypothetical protein
MTVTLHKYIQSRYLLLPSKFTVLLLVVVLLAAHTLMLLSKLRTIDLCSLVSGYPRTNVAAASTTKSYYGTGEVTTKATRASRRK